MDLLEQFGQYLGAGDTSKATIKNYTADIRQFIQWFEKTYDATFNPTPVNNTTLSLYQAYRKENGTSSRSINRHISSLRKFFSFLKDSGHQISIDVLAKKQELKADPFDLKQFKEFLWNHKSSDVTIKNYIMDLRQFVLWTETLNNEDEWDVSKRSVSDYLNSPIVEEYKNRLKASGFSKATINRKLSSIRRYADFKRIQLPTMPFSISSLPKHPVFDKEDFISAHEQNNDYQLDKTYSSFPPFRLSQKMGQGFGFLFDKTITIPASSALGSTMELLWKLKGKPIYATQQLPNYKKLSFDTHQKGSNWLKRHHSSTITRAMYLALILLSVAGGLTLYRIINKQSAESVLGTQIQDTPRTILFKAKLADKNNIPITSPSDLRLSIYNSSQASGSALLWQDVIYNVQPDSDGSFSIALGEGKPLPQSIFSQSYQAFLGITVGQNEELTPREELSTQALAQNAKALDSLLPITNPQAGTTNAILALNSSGNLIIGGNAHPVFQATGGQLTLSGQSLALATNPGTNGDVIVAPDGTGMIDIQKPIHNTSNYNHDQNALGAVEVDDLLSVLATSDAQSAFTVNQNGNGKLISGYSNSTAKFTVDNNGSAFFAGNVGIGTQIPLQSLDVKGNIMLSNTAPTIYLGPKNYIGFDTVNTLIYSTTGDIAVHPATASAFRPFSNDLYSLGNTSYRWRSLSVGSGTSNFLGRLGIGVDDPKASLQIQRNSDGNAALAIVEQGKGDLFTASSSSNMPFVIKNDGSVGIGTSNPDTKLEVIASKDATVSAIIANTSGNSDADVLALKIGSANPGADNKFLAFINGNGAVVGSISGNGTNGVTYQTTGIDFAEYFQKYDPTETFQPSDLVCLSNGKATKCSSSNSDMIGIVSDQAGFVGGSNHQNDTNYILVGLIGQLNVKVSTQNGTINPNDPLTSSSLTGVTQKATQSGRIVGRALSGFDGSEGQPCTDPSYRCGIVPILVGVSWFDPSVYLTNSGNLNIALDQPTQSYSLLDSIGQKVIAFGGFEHAIIANLQAGLITAKQITTSFLSTDKLISPIAEIDQVHTNVISPIGENSHISLKVEPNRLVITNDTNGTGSAVAQIDNNGNATFSGTLSSNTLQTSEASISGSLHAGQIFADEIVGLNKFVSQTATNSSITAEDQISSASISGELNSVTADFGQFNQGLMVLGPTGVTDISVANQLSVGASMTLSDNSISVLGGELKIQPLQTGAITFEGGLVAIDTEGNLKVMGNAEFAKDVRINGALSANLLSPIPDNDLILKLPSSQIHDSEFRIHNSSNSAVFAVNQKGDVVASGSAWFNKLNLNLITPALAVSSIEVIATGSAGMTSLKPHQVELTVKNPLVTANSLIYITPVGTPSGQTPFLQKQTPGESFTIGVEQPAFTDTNFNWLIIN